MLAFLQIRLRARQSQSDRPGFQCSWCVLMVSDTKPVVARMEGKARCIEVGRLVRVAEWMAGMSWSREGGRWLCGWPS